MCQCFIIVYFYLRNVNKGNKLRRNLPTTIIPDITLVAFVNSVLHIYIPLSSGRTSWICSSDLPTNLTLSLYLLCWFRHSLGGFEKHIFSFLSHKPFMAKTHLTLFLDGKQLILIVTLLPRGTCSLFQSCKPALFQKLHFVHEIIQTIFKKSLI